jgi:outer membrane protein assembly complex protein YaeT
LSKGYIYGLLVLLSAGSLKGQEIDDFRGQPIEAIHFVGSRLDPLDVQSYVDINEGDRFSLSAIRKSVKLLYHLGLFGQVRVMAEQGKSGVVLTFHLERRRRVLSVKFLGNEAVSSAVLKRLARIERGQEYDRWKMESVVEEILSLYRQNGYRRTRIIPRAAENAIGDVDISYFIQEGPPTRISKLQFVGQNIFRSERLAAEMGVVRGEVLVEDELNQGLEQLREFFHQQGYLEVKMTPPELDYELAALWQVVSIGIKTGPKVSFILQGNQVLTQRQLLGLLTIEQETLLTPYLLQDLAERIAVKYRETGYARVRVKYHVVDDRVFSKKKVTFIINEGPRVTVRKIEFRGNQAISDYKLRAYIENAMIEAIPQSLLAQHIDRGDVDHLGGGHPLSGRPRRVDRPQGFLFELVPETMYLKEPYEEALAKIVRLYKSRGFLDVIVGAPILSYDDSGSNLYITIPIQEKQQTFVESISFADNQKLSSSRLLDVAEGLTGFVSPGSPLDLYGVEELRKELARIYNRDGYVYCQVKKEVLFSEDKTLGAVHFVFDEGPRVKVRRIIIRGDVVTRRTVFDHSLEIRPGEIFSHDRVRASQENLFALGVFSGVDIKMLEPDVIEENKDIVITVRERLPHSLAVGPGISSAEGVRLQLEYTRRNLFGYALEFSGRAKVNYQVFYPWLSKYAERYEEMSFVQGLEGFVMAGLHWPRVWWLSNDVAARLNLIALQDHISISDLTKISLTPHLDLSLTESLMLSFEYELEYASLLCRYGSCGGSAAADRGRRYDQGVMFLGAFRPTISWDLRDNIFRPHRGTLLSLKTELANSMIINRKILYAKFEGLISGYLPVGRDTTLALSLRAGTVVHLSDDSKTPSHKVFYLGGRNSMRGFPEESLIPADQINPLDPSSPCLADQDSPGEVNCVSAGGNSYINVKTEFRFPMIPQVLDGALFVDLGNLWVDPQNFDPLNLRASAGMGFRLVTPVGPVAFDFGFNLNPDSSRREDNWSLHFNVGVF